MRYSEQNFIMVIIDEAVSDSALYIYVSDSAPLFCYTHLFCGSLRDVLPTKRFLETNQDMWLVYALR